jgi:hypothetical protein
MTWLDWLTWTLTWRHAFGVRTICIVQQVSLVTSTSRPTYICAHLGIDWTFACCLTLCATRIVWRDGQVTIITLVHTWADYIKRTWLTGFARKISMAILFLTIRTWAIAFSISAKKINYFLMIKLIHFISKLLETKTDLCQSLYKHCQPNKRRPICKIIRFV